MRGTTSITNLPRTDQVIECAQGLILRMIQRRAMKLIEIYVVGLQTLKRIFAGFDDIVTACTTLIRVLSPPPMYLGFMHNLLPPNLFLQKFFFNPFASP